MGSRRVGMNQNGRGSHQNRSGFSGRIGASSSVGAKNTSIGAKSSSIGVKSSSIGVKSSSIGAKSSSIGVKSSSIGAKGKSISAKGTSIAAKSSNIGAKSPSIGAKSPRICAPGVTMGPNQIVYSYGDKKLFLGVKQNGIPSGSHNLFVPNVNRPSTKSSGIAGSLQKNPEYRKAEMSKRYSRSTNYSNHFTSYSDPSKQNKEVKKTALEALKAMHCTLPEKRQRNLLLSSPLKQNEKKTRRVHVVPESKPAFHRKKSSSTSTILTAPTRSKKSSNSSKAKEPALLKKRIAILSKLSRLRPTPTKIPSQNKKRESSKQNNIYSSKLSKRQANPVISKVGRKKSSAGNSTSGSTSTALQKVKVNVELLQEEYDNFKLSKATKTPLTISKNDEKDVAKTEAGALAIFSSQKKPPKEYRCVHLSSILTFEF